MYSYVGSLVLLRVSDVLDHKLAVGVVLAVLCDGGGQHQGALGQGLGQGLEVEVNLKSVVDRRELEDYDERVTAPGSSSWTWLIHIFLLCTVFPDT